MMISTPPYLTIDIKSFLPEILRGTSVTQIEMAQQGRTYQAQKYWGGGNKIFENSRGSGRMLSLEYFEYRSSEVQSG